MRGALATLEKLTQIFPDDVSLKNELGVAHLLLGDNKGAKRVYEEVCAARWSRCPDVWSCLTSGPTGRSWPSPPPTDLQKFIMDLF